MDFLITVVDIPGETVRTDLGRHLHAYNTTKIGITEGAPLALVIEDSMGQVIGGLYGNTALGWLFIEMVFIPESLRNRGLGRDIVLGAEARAVTRGCHSAWLDTFDFQARGFYERLGYTTFGRLDAYPVGYSRWFMRKALDNGGTSRV